MYKRIRDISKLADLGVHHYASIDEFALSPIKQGLNTIVFGGREFDFFWEDRGASVTLITFTAAVPAKALTYPIFSSRPLAARLNVNYLAFADPAAGGTVALPTFWHLGTSELPSTTLIPQIVRKSKDESKGKHLLFFGSSAGGFAALNYSSQFARSAALVMNPRINVLHEPKRAPKYAPVAFPNVPLATAIRTLPYDQAQTYNKSCENFVVYLQNKGDTTYKRHHYAHFEKAVRGRHDVHFILRDWGKGHLVPPREVFENLLKKLVASAPDWNKSVLPLRVSEDDSRIVDRTLTDHLISVSETFTRLGQTLRDTEDRETVAQTIADAESATVQLRSL